MVLRTARRGKNAGGQFFGCSQYPKCKGTLPIEVGTFGDLTLAPTEEALITEQPLPSEDRPLTGKKETSPVQWSDSLLRDDWISEYFSIGSVPFLISQNSNLLSKEEERLLSHTVFIYKRSVLGSKVSQSALVLSNVIQKILRRGICPITSPQLEEKAILEAQLLSQTEDLSTKKVEFGRRWKENQKQLKDGAIRSQRDIQRQFNPDRSIRDMDGGTFDSHLEAKFFNDWLPSITEYDPRNWIFPQAPLEVLASATDGDLRLGGRRVDFFFAHPSGEKLVIEIDGDEHQDNPELDAARDQLLNKLGVEVYRIPNSEVLAGSGPNLSRLSTRIKDALKQPEAIDEDSLALAKLCWNCSFGSKLQLAIAWALQKGILEAGGHWVIRLQGGTDASITAIHEICELILWLDQLYQLEAAPETVLVKSGNSEVFYKKVDCEYHVETVSFERSQDKESDLFICLDRDGFTLERIEEDVSDPYHLVIRPTFLPFELAAPEFFRSTRVRSNLLTLEQYRYPLQGLLRFIFRKYDFREGQLEAISNTLKGIDSVVLLPTGAGKSIIYQLSGLLLPGVTLVIDPLVSLIEDQIEGLKAYGITKAIGINAYTLKGNRRERILSAVGRGEYLFVLLSPERLQDPKFRVTLTELSQVTVINLTVIDEAHCVSEWGHDFRPSYLHLGRNLREFCKDMEGIAPPLIALTGTASRAVLRDLLADLEISTTDSNALIRPMSFDRSEISYDIRRAKPGAAMGVLAGLLHSIPNDFGFPTGEFYKPSKALTNSGIIFTKHANGALGVSTVAQNVRSTVPTDVTIYSGSAPKGFVTDDWEETKRQNAKRFKANQSPVLVAPKAFGMGIDKPNIRYTIHYGMPNSLEAFYQEAGRAGRDRKQARSYIVYSEFSPEVTDKLLDPSKDVESIRTIYNELPRGSRDDGSNALWFHLNSFQGIENELRIAEKVLSRIFPSDQAQLKQIPFNIDADQSGPEKAIFRLLQCGVLSDYEVDHGSKIYGLYVRPFDAEEIKKSVLQYVASSQPGRVRDIDMRLNAIELDTQQNYALKVLRIFISFIYDVIERSRRRSLQESMLAARESNEEAFRRRLLDYLQEGIGSEAIQELLARSPVDFSDWIVFLEKMSNAVEAGEIRGVASRFLESYPDHPGLLLLRGISEAKSSYPNEPIMFQSLIGSFEMALTRYALSREDIDQLIDLLYVHIKAGTLNKLSSAFIQATYSFNTKRDEAKSFSKMLRELAEDDPTAAKIYKTLKLKELEDKALRATNFLEKSYEGLI